VTKLHFVIFGENGGLKNSMLYLSDFLHAEVRDTSKKVIGKLNDLLVNERDVFPRVTALSYLEADTNADLSADAHADAGTLIDWTEFVAGFELSDDDKDPNLVRFIDLKVEASQLKPREPKEDEFLLMHDLRDKQIFDVKNKKLARVSDLRLTAPDKQLRLMGVDYGLRGRLQFMSATKAGLTKAWMTVSAQPIREQLITWNYLEIPIYDRTKVVMSIGKDRLPAVKPAELAKTLEELETNKCTRVFEILDDDPVEKEAIDPHDIIDPNKDSLM